MGLKTINLGTGVVKSAESIRCVMRETIVNVIMVFLATIFSALAAFGSRSALSCYLPFHQKKERIGETLNWLSLPDDVTCKILGYLDQRTILEHVQFTCKLWYDICKDPAMWKTVDLGIMDDESHLHDSMRLEAVSRGAGHVMAITVENCSSLGHFREIARRTNSSLKRLTLYCCHLSDNDIEELFAMFPLLEVFEASICFMYDPVIIALGRHCPLLHTFRWCPRYPTDHDLDVASLISKNLPGLRHITAFSVLLSNEGLEALLNSCKHLETLDIRHGMGVDLKNGSSLLKRLQQIKHLRLPHECYEHKEIYFSKSMINPTPD